MRGVWEMGDMLAALFVAALIVLFMATGYGLGALLDGIDWRGRR